jgi:hypothetical protein
MNKIEELAKSLQELFITGRPVLSGERTAISKADPEAFRFGDELK